MSSISKSVCVGGGGDACCGQLGAWRDNAECKFPSFT